MNFTPNQLQMIASIVMQSLTTWQGMPQQIIQMLMSGFRQPNGMMGDAGGPYWGQLLQYLATAIPMDQWTNPQGIHANTITPHIQNFIKNAAQTILAQMNQGGMGQPMMGMGMGMNPMMAGMSANVMGGFATNQQPSYTGTLYSTNTAVPQQQAPQAQPQQQMPTATPQMPEVKMPTFQLRESACPSDIGSPDLTVTSYMMGESADARASFTVVEDAVPATAPLDIARHLFQTLPPDYLRGTYAVVCSWTQLVTVNVGLETYRNTASDVLKAYRTTAGGTESVNGTNWAAAFEVLQKGPYGTVKAIGNAVKDRLNERLFHRLRIGSTGEGPILDVLEEVTQISGATWKMGELTDHPLYHSTLRDEIKATLEDMFNPTHIASVQGDRDEGFGIYAIAKGVQSNTPGIHPYAYGELNDADRHALIQRVLERNTVIKIPRSLVFTNAVANPSVLGFARDGRIVRRVIDDQIGPLYHMLKSAQVGYPDLVLITAPTSNYDPAQELIPAVLSRGLDGKDFLSFTMKTLGW